MLEDAKRIDDLEARLEEAVAAQLGEDATQAIPGTPPDEHPDEPPHASPNALTDQPADTDTETRADDTADAVTTGIEEDTADVAQDDAGAGGAAKKRGDKNRKKVKKARAKSADSGARKGSQKRARKGEQAAAGKEHEAPMGSSRGIETLFRTAYDTQLGLTSLADAKANMMISINGIMISIIIAAVVPRLEDNTLLLLPTAIFLIGTLVAIVFAIRAAQPRIWQRKAPVSEHDGRDNLLFFGEFARRTEQQFVDDMVELAADRTRTYEAMLRNIYGLGAVLRRKFHLLSISYASFMLALVLGAASTIAVYLLA